MKNKNFRSANSLVVVFLLSLTIGLDLRAGDEVKAPSESKSPEKIVLQWKDFFVRAGIEFARLRMGGYRDIPDHFRNGTLVDIEITNIERLVPDRYDSQNTAWKTQIDSPYEAIVNWSGQLFCGTITSGKCRGRSEDQQRLAVSLAFSIASIGEKPEVINLDFTLLLDPNLELSRRNLDPSSSLVWNGDPKLLEIEVSDFYFSNQNKLRIFGEGVPLNSKSQKINFSKDPFPKYLDTQIGDGRPDTTTVLKVLRRADYKFFYTSTVYHRLP